MQSWVVLFVLTEIFRGLMCGDNLLSDAQLLQHKENSLPSKWHTLYQKNNFHTFMMIPNNTM